MSESAAAPKLRLVDAETGEFVERKYSYDELLTIKKKHEHKLSGAMLQIGNLEKELANARGKEPDSQEVREVLEFYRDLSGRRKIAIDPSSQRWAKTRARLRQKCDPRITVDRLKAALVGAPKADWFKDQPERQDPLVVFKTAEFVEKCEAAAGRPTQQVRVVDVTPIEAAQQTLAREFGIDAVRASYDPEHGRLEEVWAMCPLHPTAGLLTSLRLRERRPNGSLELACAGGCDPEDILEALRCLYGLQAARVPSDEIAELRVQVHDLERTLRAYSWESFYKEDKHGQVWVMRDGGYMARRALGLEAPPQENGAA